MIKLLKEIPGVKTNLPNGAFYLFPDVSHYLGTTDGETTIKSSTELCLYLLDKAHVALVPGDAFGSPNSIRISYAASAESLKEALNRIKPVLENLQKI